MAARGVGGQIFELFQDFVDVIGNRAKYLCIGSSRFGNRHHDRIPMDVKTDNRTLLMDQCSRLWLCSFEKCDNSRKA